LWRWQKGLLRMAVWLTESILGSDCGNDNKLGIGAWINIESMSDMGYTLGTAVRFCPLPSWSKSLPDVHEILALIPCQLVSKGSFGVSHAILPQAVGASCFRTLITNHNHCLVFA
jgi:hypothetical protein